MTIVEDLINTATIQTVQADLEVHFDVNVHIRHKGAGPLLCIITLLLLIIIVVYVPDLVHLLVIIIDVDPYHEALLITKTSFEM